MNKFDEAFVHLLSQPYESSEKRQRVEVCVIGFSHLLVNHRTRVLTHVTKVITGLDSKEFHQVCTTHRDVVNYVGRRPFGYTLDKRHIRS